ncbi:MAG: hypothetical protein CMK59_13740 [Proteobacteria bacterium]|nr:hypothetical protein [Pseudomonadota bacterium]
MENKTTVIVWFALILSIFAYGGVAWFISPKGGSDPELIEMLSIAFTILGLVTTVVVVMGANLFKSVDFDTFTIIRAALSESIAIYGLVLCFLSGNFTYIGAFIAWSVGLFLFCFPSESARAAFEENKGA